MQILGIANSYASAPNAPTSLTNTSQFTATSSCSATISFTAPSDDGGAAITNYEYSFNGSSWTAFSPADTTSPVIITGLDVFTNYTVYLRAVNANGAGVASSATTVQTPDGVEFGTSQPNNSTAFQANLAGAGFCTNGRGNSVTGIIFQRSLSSNMSSPTTFAASPSTAAANATTNVTGTLTGHSNLTTYYVRLAGYKDGVLFVGNTTQQYFVDI